MAHGPTTAAARARTQILSCRRSENSLALSQRSRQRSAEKSAPHTHAIRCRALTLRPARPIGGARAEGRWRTYVPDVDLYVSPCYAIELPDEDADELDVRLPLTSFLRWVNLIGWAGLAIGNVQLVAPTDEVVLAAGLAWECGP